MTSRSALLSFALVAGVAFATAGCDTENRQQNASNFCPGGVALTTADVNDIIVKVVSQAQAVGVLATVAVTDREGEVLGVFTMTNTTVDVNGDGVIDALDNIRPANVQAAISKSLTVSYFQSEQEAFTTRTAFFIVQGHYPPGVRNAGGGPLFGVQDSSLTSSDNRIGAYDQNGIAVGAGISGEFGGVPLYKNGCPVGGVGVDTIDVLVNLPPAPNPDSALTLLSPVQNDVDEALALSGAVNFATPQVIQATSVFVDGISFPFVDTIVDFIPPDAAPSAAGLQTAGIGAIDPQFPIRASPLAPEIIVDGRFGIRPQTRFTGRVVSRSESDFNTPPLGNAGSSFVNVDRNAAIVFDTMPTSVDGDPGFRFENVPIVTVQQGVQVTPVGDVPGEFNFSPIDGIEPPPAEGGLTSAEVRQIMVQAAFGAESQIAGIRLPRGVPVKVHIVVIDRRGNLLGVFRLNDGTRFSFDVAVQKARTCAFFSTDGTPADTPQGQPLPPVAFACRSIGFLAQPFFPIGLDGELPGPLVNVRDLVNRGKVTIEVPPSLTTINPPPRPPSDGTTDENVLLPGNQLFDDYGGAPPAELGQIRELLGETGGFYLLADRPDVGFVSPGIQAGIQTFPGGVPLYKNGRLVGAVGISGDGVDEDDRAAHFGHLNFEPPPGIRVDEVSEGAIGLVLTAKVTVLVSAIQAHPDLRIRNVYGPIIAREKDFVENRFNRSLGGVRIPYTKFPRNPTDF